ncbi:hypothetical protein Sulku_2227 [Sulfuricurvum kujiense DSM 16994]|uniref:Copper resistance protein D domain-containing protein n=1 Tax=Sulfuricurvum kujiense (strain ATCC BAA-921 / DSM 16994 / JCM 11577 / YK-1) TaxID=709032 RepID=E4TWP1_SULKY|nr:hypothetical protein [Sulfuricurvum kujiense]ADR34887.1 hypothetical protein Sulku_2227 [Sulfuricurvum kujiense DSM 16994]
MKEFLIETFTHHRTLIVFLHVLSAVVWVGGMISIRFAAHQSMQLITDPKLRLERASHTLKRLFAIVTPFVIILIVTAVLMAVGLGFRAAAMDASGNVIDEYAMSIYNTVHIKEAIWLVMTINLGAMMFRRKRAERALEMGNLDEAKNMLAIIAKYMVPVNIVLGVTAIFIGVVLRNAY